MNKLLYAVGALTAFSRLCAQGPIRVQPVSNTGVLQVGIAQRVTLTGTGQPLPSNVRLRARVFAGTIQELQSLVAGATPYDCVELWSRTYPVRRSGATLAGPMISEGWFTVRNGIVGEKSFVIVFERLQPGEADGPVGDPSVLRLTQSAAEKYLNSATEFLAVPDRTNYPPQDLKDITDTINRTDSAFRVTVKSRAEVACAVSVGTVGGSLTVDVETVPCETLRSTKPTEKEPVQP